MSEQMKVLGLVRDTGKGPKTDVFWVVEKRPKKFRVTGGGKPVHQRFCREVSLAFEAAIGDYQGLLFTEDQDALLNESGEAIFTLSGAVQAVAEGLGLEAE